jgi:hypothetical protein
VIEINECALELSKPQVANFGGARNFTEPAEAHFCRRTARLLEKTAVDAIAVR